MGERAAVLRSYPERVVIRDVGPRLGEMVSLTRLPDCEGVHQFEVRVDRSAQGSK